MSLRNMIQKNMNKSLSSKICLKEDLPVLKKIATGQEFVLLTNDVAYLTHSIHKYPSKFIPQVPRWAIKKHLKNKMNSYVYDPMCGSGTTLLEAMVNGHNSIGLDIDPLACLISKVKVTSINENKLERIFHEIKTKISRRKKGNFLPEIENLDHWFNKITIEQLSLLRNIIDEYADDPNIHNFLVIVYSSIIRKVSNADNQSQKTYVSHNVIKISPEPIPLFLYRLEKYCTQIKQLAKFRKNTKHFVYISDTRKQSEIKKIAKESMDLAITSPPYIKAIDYIYTNMVEYFWIGDIFGLSNRHKMNEYRQKYIGTKQIYSQEYNSELKLNIPEIDDIVNKINKKNLKFGYITAKYFHDICLNLESTRNIIKPKSHYVMVVGDCSVAGIEIPVHKLICKIAKKSGYDIDTVFSYVIRNRFMRFPRQGRGGLITHDWIIDLNKTN